MYANSDGSGETVLVRSLASAITGRLDVVSAIQHELAQTFLKSQQHHFMSLLNHNRLIIT